MRHGSPRQIKAMSSSSVANIPGPSKQVSHVDQQATSSNSKPPPYWFGQSGDKVVSLQESRSLSRSQKVDSVQHCLTHLDSRGVDVQGLTAQELADGNLRSSLKLLTNVRKKSDTEYNYRDIADGAPESPQSFSRPNSRPSSTHFQYYPNSVEMHPPKTLPPQRQDGSSRRSTPNSEALQGILHSATSSTDYQKKGQYPGMVVSTESGQPAVQRGQEENRHSYHSSFQPPRPLSAKTVQEMAPRQQKPISVTQAWQANCSPVRARATFTPTSATTAAAGNRNVSDAPSVEQRLRNLVLAPSADPRPNRSTAMAQNKGIVNGAYSYDDGELLVPPPPQPRDDYSWEEGESAERVNTPLTARDGDPRSYRYVPSQPRDKLTSTPGQGRMDSGRYPAHTQAKGHIPPTYNPPPQYSGAARTAMEIAELPGALKTDSAGSGNQADLRNAWNKLYMKDGSSKTTAELPYSQKSSAYSPHVPLKYPTAAGYISHTRSSPMGQSSSANSQSSQSASTSPGNQVTDQPGSDRKTCGRSLSPAKNLASGVAQTSLPTHGTPLSAGHRKSPAPFQDVPGELRSSDKYPSASRPSMLSSHEQPVYANVASLRAQKSSNHGEWSTAQSPGRSASSERTLTNGDIQRYSQSPSSISHRSVLSGQAPRSQTPTGSCQQTVEHQRPVMPKWAQEHSSRPKTPLSSGGSEARDGSWDRRGPKHQQLQQYQPPEYAKINVDSKMQSRAQKLEHAQPHNSASPTQKDFYRHSKELGPSVCTSTPHKAFTKADLGRQKWRDSVASEISVDSSFRSVTPPLPPLSPSNTPPMTPPESPQLGRAYAHGDMNNPPGYLPTRKPDLVTSARNGVGKKRVGRRPHGVAVRPAYEGKKWRTAGKALGGRSPGRTKMSRGNKDNIDVVQESDDSNSNDDDYSSYDEGDSTHNVSHTATANDTRDDTMDHSEALAMRQQLEGLETMYLEILKLLGVDKEYAPGSRRSISSVSSMSRTGPGASYHRARRGQHWHSRHRRELKHINKRFTRLESHVVTLARSVAHLSSEMRSQGPPLQHELDAIRKDIHELKKQRRSSAPKGAATFTEWEKFRGWVPSVTNPKRVHKLTKFFGQEPPLLHIFLKRLGYERYANNFDAEKITMLELPYLNEERLIKIGIPMGPRLRILQESQMCFRQENFDIYIV